MEGRSRRPETDKKTVLHFHHGRQGCGRRISRLATLGHVVHVTGFSPGNVGAFGWPAPLPPASADWAPAALVSSTSFASAHRRPVDTQRRTSVRNSATARPPADRRSLGCAYLRSPGERRRSPWDRPTTSRRVRSRNTPPPPPGRNCTTTDPRHRCTAPRPLITDLHDNTAGPYDLGTSTRRLLLLLRCGSGHVIQWQLPSEGRQARGVKRAGREAPEHLRAGGRSAGPAPPGRWPRAGRPPRRRLRRHSGPWAGETARHVAAGVLLRS